MLKIIRMIVLMLGVLQVLQANISACEASLAKVHPTQSELRESCLDVAQEAERSAQYSSASWYYLLAGKQQYNREVIAGKISFSDGNYANVAHSFVLDGNLSEAGRYYRSFLSVAALREADVAMQEDYALLHKIYPEKAQQLQQGWALWRKIAAIVEQNKPEIRTLNAEVAKHTAVGAYQKMVDAYQKLLPLYKESFGEVGLNIAALYANLGVAYNNLSRYDEALHYKRKALEMRQEILSPTDLRLSDSYNDLGISYMIIGNSEKALIYFQQALSIRKQHPEQEKNYLSQLYSSMARAYEELKQYKEAQRYHQKAIALSESGGDLMTKAYSYHNMGGHYLEKKEYAKAITYMKRALKLRRQEKPQNILGIIQSYSSLAEVYLQWHKADDALAYAKQAVALQEQYAPLSIGMAESYQTLGWGYFGQGKFKKSYHFAKKAFDLFLAQRSVEFQQLNAKDKEQYIKTHQRHMALLMMSTYRARQSLKMLVDTMIDWVHYKGSLFESENSFAIAYRNTTDPQIKQKIRRLMEMKRELARLYHAKEKQESRKILQLQAESVSITKELAAEVKKIAVLQKRHSITDVEMVKSLKKEELYIDFAKIAENYFVFALSAEGFLDMHLIGAKITTQIESEIHAFRKEMTETSKVTQKRAKRLYRLLLADILEKKPFRDKSTLIISPDGLLNLFPFEALYDAKKRAYLIETKKIRYVPNGKALVSFSKDQHKSKQQKMAIFANPDYNMQDSDINSSSVQKNASYKEAFSYLPGTMEEVMLILQSMKPQQTQVYLGREATEKNLFALKSPKILHISTHGYFLESDEPNPMLKSALALSGANHALVSRDSEGLVTALKLSGLDLEETELVVLSACETGVTDEDATESISGLSQAFIEAGSQAVIVTLWPVSVKGSNLFMELFYQKVAEGISYTAALQAVKQKMIKMELPISVWAPFVINGS